MWRLVFNVTFDGKYMFSFDEEGRSPKHGVRIFNKVIIDIID